MTSWSTPPTREHAFNPEWKARKDPKTEVLTPLHPMPTGYAWATWDHGERNVSIWWRPDEMVGVKWTRPASEPVFCVLQTQQDRDKLWEWLVTPQETIS